MGEARERENRAMLRVRDAIDRDYAAELDVQTLARLVHLSPRAPDPPVQGGVR